MEISTQVNVPTTTNALLFYCSMSEKIINLPSNQFTHRGNIPVKVFPFVVIIFPDLKNDILADDASVDDLRARFFWNDLSFMLCISKIKVYFKLFHSI